MKMLQASSSWKGAQERLERHDDLPHVLIQVEALLGRTSDAQREGAETEEEAGFELKRLLQAFAAFGVVSCFVTYARTARDIQRAEGLLKEAVGNEEGLKTPRLVCITQNTTRVALLYALTYPKSAFQRTILFCSSADDALAISARKADVEVVSCSMDNDQISTTFFLQHIVRSHVRMYKASLSPKEKQPIVIGYLVKWSRACSLGRQKLLHLRIIDGVCYVPVEHLMNLEHQQSKFDLLLHKASDWMMYDKEGNALKLSLPPVFQSLKDARCPPWLDAVDTTLPILSRMDIHKLVAELENENQKVFMPRTGLLQECEHALEGRAPFIVKSNVACGVSFSHKMIIVHRFQKQEFEKLLTTCYANLRDLVVQDFVDHDGYEMKVYCIGEDSYLYRRQLGEESPSTDDTCVDFTVFDSLESKSKNPDKTNYPIQDEDKEVLLECAKWLRTRLNLTLFGFDALKVRGSGQITIIDVNYFPSFKGIAGAQSSLHSVCLKKAMIGNL